MSVPTAVMLDDIGSNSRNIPPSTPYVGGYVTGLGNVPWTPDEWALFPHARKVRIAQGAGNPVGLHDFDMIDVEALAVTPQSAAAMVNSRVSLGIQLTTVYGTDSTLALVTEEILKFGAHTWNGHVNYFLADWNLNEIEAAAKLGTLIHGASCVGVQWASPSSNPDTIVPGGTLPLKAANVDISVVDANWIPSGGFTGNPLPVPPVVTYHGMLITTDASGMYVARQVSSTDDINWK